MFTRTCPKCSYARKEYEVAPAWQCPSCGIAYDKYGRTPATVLKEPTDAAQAKAAENQEAKENPQPFSVGGVPVFTNTWSRGPSIGQYIGLIVLLCSALYFGYQKLTHKPPPPVTSEANLNAPVAIFYSAAWCPNCKLTRKMMEREGVKYVEIDVEKTPGRQEHLRKKFHVTGFPIVEVGDEIVAGYNPRELSVLFAKAQRN